MILGIGLDILDVSRVAEQVGTQGEAFVLDFLLPEEIAECRATRHPIPFYAVRFAAKEACAKALGTGVWGRLSWHDIQVGQDDHGAPTLTLRGAAHQVALDLGVRAIRVSFSHGESHAAAVVVLEG